MSQATEQADLPLDQEQFSYDTIPYVSHAFWQTKPAHLAVMGEIFGMKPVNPAKARVLEIGGASGWNLIPLAQLYPNAEFVNMDLGKVQIDDGAAHVKNLGLKNIEMRHASVTDIDESWGKFDYIICHGVFSWIPEDAQDAVLRVCKENMSKNGLAYISYNTLPGWNMVRSVREMMMFHASRFEKPEEKAYQSRVLLQFILDNTAQKNNPYRDAIENELNILKNQPDSYLLHEHLEDNNKQFYFHEFMTMAHNKGLQYLGDSYIASMFAGNLPPQAAEKLSATNNLIMSEQYMDYLRNRRFRTSILCHGDQKLNRQISMDILLDYDLSTNLKPSFDPDTIDWKTTKTFSFGESVTANDRITAMWLTLLSRATTPISGKELAKQAMEKLEMTDAQIVENSLKKTGIRLVLNGMIQLHNHGPKRADKVTAKPVVWEIARYQAPNTNRVTNLAHDNIPIDPVSQMLIPLFDGTNDKKAIVAKMIELVKQDKLSVKDENQKLLTDDKKIEERISSLYGNLTQQFLRQDLLIK